MLPPLRPHVQQKHGIIHGSDCKYAILNLYKFFVATANL